MKGRMKGKVTMVARYDSIAAIESNYLDIPHLVLESNYLVVISKKERGLIVILHDDRKLKAFGLYKVDIDNNIIKFYNEDNCFEVTITNIGLDINSILFPRDEKVIVTQINIDWIF